MKYLTLLFVGLFIFVSAPVQAEEITMICKYDGQTRIHKYINPPIGFKKVLQRFDGEWIKWGSVPSEERISSKLKITDRGAILETVLILTADKDYPDELLKMGDKFKHNYRYVLDFEFLRRSVTWYMTYLNDNPFPNKKLKGNSPENPLQENWNCKKYNPSGSKKN